jgi:hypothetical protein
VLIKIKEHSNSLRRNFEHENFELLKEVQYFNIYPYLLSFASQNQETKETLMGIFRTIRYENSVRELKP